jgi:hypothetical protein
MASRSEFLDQAWTDIINSPMQEHWIDNVIREADQSPDAPFADLGPVVKRLLASGASRKDLCLISRFASYEAVFQTLYMLEDPGVDGETAGLYESLLGSDPSGKEGRPGSAPGSTP